MKKYWIKDLTEKQVIHAPTADIAKKLCNKFHELGLKWFNGSSYLNITNWNLYEEGTCYNCKIGKFSDKAKHTIVNAEILTIDQLLDFQEVEYPKVMEVSNNGSFWCKRVVFMEKNGKFLAWDYAKSIEEAERVTDVGVWRYAREVQPTLELTIEQIAEKFNVSPEQIKIKK